MMLWLIGVAIAVLLWGLLWKSSPRLAFGAVVGFLIALALNWIFAPQLTMLVTGMNEIPVWLPPLPIVLVVIVLFYFGFRTWLNADNLPPPRETKDDHHSHGHH